jgi:thiol-disulfide isomerase/thioredoxin
MKRAANVVVWVCLLSAGAWLGAGAAGATGKTSQLLVKSAGAQIGQPAPWLAGCWTLEGQPFNVQLPFAEPGVQRLALVFWATWCPNCRAGIAVLNRAADELRRAGVKVVLVNIGETNEAIRNYLARNPTTFSIALDFYANAKDTYLDVKEDKNMELPRTVIIGRDGVVRRIIGEEGEDYVAKVRDEK